MVGKAFPALLNDASRRQYKNGEEVADDQQRRIRRLIKAGVMPKDNPYKDCEPGVCGARNLPPKGRKVPSPYPCSAFCRFGQYRLQLNEVDRIARLVSEIDPEPLFVTVINPRYWMPIEELPSFSTIGIKQSILRALKKVPGKNGDRIVAIGRVDFDLAGEPSSLQARPHIHLIVGNADKSELHTALYPKFDRKTHTVRKPIVIEPVRDIGSLHYTIKCLLKGLPQNHSLAGLQNARSRPLAHADQAFDEFLLRHQLFEVLILHGVRRSGGKLRRIK